MSFTSMMSNTQTLDAYVACRKWDKKLTAQFILLCRCGLEGPFRLSCEAALGVMRRQKDILVASLRPFVFDPLVDWVVDDERRGKGGKKAGKGGADPTGEVVNETGVETLKAIEARLDGYVNDMTTPSSVKTSSKKNSRETNVSLSVAGQVQHLIKEATSLENLSQMYYGWGAYV